MISLRLQQRHKLHNKETSKTYNH